MVSSDVLVDALGLTAAHAHLLIDTVLYLSPVPGGPPTQPAPAAPRCSLHELSLLLVAQLYCKETARHHDADDPWPEISPPSPGRLGCSETLGGPGSPTKIRSVASGTSID